MKKLLLLLSALLLAFLFTEFLVSDVVCYPKYGVERKIVGIRSSDNGIQNVYIPHSEYWNVEGGNRVFRRNNLGLPGTDVKVSDSSRYVLVLGSSYIEAYQVPPDSMATSIFQRKLSNDEPRFQVVNLGHSGHDPYDSYLRSAYFDRTFQPAAVVLVIQDNGAAWLSRHPHPLAFTRPAGFGKRTTSLITEVAIFARNHSSLINIIATAIKADEEKRARDEVVSRIGKSPVNLAHEAAIPEDLLTCFKEFYKKYEERFWVLSILPDGRQNDLLREYCGKRHIKFLGKELGIRDNLIAGSGHLNVGGNRVLGELLYDSFVRFAKKP